MRKPKKTALVRSAAKKMGLTDDDMSVISKRYGGKVKVVEDETPTEVLAASIADIAKAMKSLLATVVGCVIRLALFCLFVWIAITILRWMGVFP